MRNYITESMASGIIRPSSSPVAAGFFFVSNKDGVPVLTTAYLTTSPLRISTPSHSLAPPSNHLRTPRCFQNSTCVTCITWFVSERGMNGRWDLTPT